MMTALRGTFLLLDQILEQRDIDDLFILCSK